MPWRRLPQLHIFHPIQKYLPSLPSHSVVYQECVKATPPEALSQAQAMSSSVASMLHRARSPTAWKSFPYSDRYYYERKWGGEVGKVCGAGEYMTPFNDPTNALSLWLWDKEMRLATVKGTPLENFFSKS